VNFLSHDNSLNLIRAPHFSAANCLKKSVTDTVVPEKLVY